MAPILDVFSGFSQAAGIEAQARGAIQSQQAEAAAAEYNQKIAMQNAGIIDQQTQSQLDVQDRQRRLRAGTALANAGASGVGIESFSDTFSSNAAQEELDLLTIASEGNLKSSQYRQQATLLGMTKDSSLAQIPFIRSGAKAGKTAAVISGISQGVKTATNGAGF